MLFHVPPSVPVAPWTVWSFAASSGAEGSAPWGKVAAPDTTSSGSVDAANAPRIPNHKTRPRRKSLEAAIPM
eukprot:1321911-Rhodomonas_salina.3